MKRTSYLVLMITFLSLGLVQCQKEEKKPNVILFLVDDLGWMDIGCYGSEFYETPNIDQLAEEGIRFTDAYAACHVCSPSRAALMTGKYPARVNLTDWLPGRKNHPFQRYLNAEVNQELPMEEVTLAEALKEHGYATGIFGKWHLSPDSSAGPLKHGFDTHFIKGWNKGWPLGYYPPYRMAGFDGDDDQYLTDRVTDEALKFIEGNKEKPFFLYLAHFAVHDPIDGRKDLVEKYNKKLAATSFGPEPAYGLEANPDAEGALSREELNAKLDDPAYAGYSKLPGGAVKIKQHQDNTNFAAMVEAMDESMGRVLAKLDELGLDENTIVIFASDNGGMAAANFGNPQRDIDPAKLDRAFSTSNLPLRGAKGWLYEGGIRVPMIVKWKGVKSPGETCSVPVTSTDFYPSILEMAGLPLMPSQHVDGVSFVPLLKGETKLDRDAIYWHFPHYSNHGMQSPGGAIRRGDYKLIEYFENNTVELFNLKDDIGEKHDLSKEKPEVVEELREMLHNWRRNVNARMMPPNPNYVPGKEPWLQPSKGVTGEFIGQ